MYSRMCQNQELIWVLCVLKRLVLLRLLRCCSIRDYLDFEYIKVNFKFTQNLQQLVCRQMTSTMALYDYQIIQIYTNSGLPFSRSFRKWQNKDLRSSSCWLSRHSSSDRQFQATSHSTLTIFAGSCLIPSIILYFATVDTRTTQNLLAGVFPVFKI